ncbi:MAG: hypothetical protein M1833_003386 [Piccolia ochrophora]|nr:MAG: hypothetical protein M1833_003386 [Piccolia ochrophora]
MAPIQTSARTVWMYVPSIQQQELVGLLLDRGADLGQSNALHAAAKRADGIPMMAYLLDRGFDINALEHQANPTYFETFKQLGHKTALQIVARKGRIGHVRFLLDRGADRTIKDSRGCTAADWARSCNHPECYELVKVDD